MSSFAENSEPNTVYFKTLALENVRCFKGQHEVDFRDGHGKPAQWTVILGNNNTGKTTILKALADMNKYEKIVIEPNFAPNMEKVKDMYLLSSLASNRMGGLIIGLDGVINIHLFVEESTDFKIGEKPYGSLFGINRRNGGHPNWQVNSIVTNLNLYGYGTSRFMSNNGGMAEDSTAGIFDNKSELLNAEQWLKDLHLAKVNNSKDAEKRYAQVEDILCGGLLPDVSKIQITTIPDKSSYDTFPEFLTPYGWVRLRDLGYGYQATLAWVADLAKRMFDRYPDLENPLVGPAVVLVDEIDLHLHPEWQRKIMKYLSDLFLNTQFIVTAHSPLIVQSAKDVNVVMLEVDEDEIKGINIRQRFGSFQGWTVDEILTELMNLGSRTRSDRYLELMQTFEDSVLEDNYEKAQNAYNELDSILSPSSYQRKVLQIQMSSLIPVAV